MYEPRPKQLEVLSYEGGRMGVAAVPGSGKTWTLSYLAAKLVASGLEEDQEVLIVTLVNSAVENFAHRIALFLKEEMGLLPGLGYRVRTLHGLSNDIVRERPGLVGLSEDFGIVDERQSNAILDDAAQAWMRVHPETFEAYVSPDIVGEGKIRFVRDGFRNWPTLVRAMARAFIRRAKDRNLTPDEVQACLDAHGIDLPLARMGVQIYSDYQHGLTARGGVDFDDLNRLARQALRLDSSLLERLRHRWPYILEDEAQDSNEMQEQILNELAGSDGNWVRVGDPNQAIFQTFTNANPRYLRRFLERKDVARRELSNSGRSTLSIMRLANYMVDWTLRDHPLGNARSAFLEQHIEPSPPGDPQPNPPDDPHSVRLQRQGLTPEAEVSGVVESLQKWMTSGSPGTVAVLVPRNQRGTEVAKALKQAGIPYVELLQSTTHTRNTAGALAHLLRHLVDPLSSRRLQKCFEVWRRGDREDEDRHRLVKRALKMLKTCSRLEDYIWPRLDRDWLSGLAGELLPDKEPKVYALLEEFRGFVQRWHKTSDLPIDQLVLTLAQDIFTEARDLALAHKLAVLLRGVQDRYPEWRTSDLVDELIIIARNQRRFLGFAQDDIGFEPPEGKVTVATMHKAKGLEWDRVYLLSVSNYDFPSGQPHDDYYSEKWFVRGNLNLEAETLAQLSAISDEDEPYVEGEATREARYELVCERLRLLYVGITRARRELVIGWNSGRGHNNQAAAPLIALQDFWEEEGGER